MKLRCLSTPHKVRGQYDDKSMADQVGVSKSEVSRETIEAGTRVLKELVERDLSELDVLVVYLDGIVFGDYHVLAAVGVDADGRKHVLGLCGGASENTEVTAGLLEDLVARGLRADRRRLFVIDGAKALRQAIGRVFGSSNLVQRCRNHKVRNVPSARALADTGAGADRLLSCRKATLRRGQAAPLERDATHPLAQPHAGAAQASTGGRGDHGPAGAVPRAHGRQDPHAPQLLPEEPSSFRLHHNGRARASAGQRRRRKRHPSRHQSPHQGRIHLLATGERRRDSSPAVFL